MSPTKKALAFVLGFVLLVGGVLGAAGRASAVQNRPSWTAGDFWTYRSVEGSTTITITWSVLSRTALTLTGGTYEVWYVNVTTSAQSGGTTVIQTSDMWVQDADLGLAKTSATIQVPVFGAQTTTTTFDPPRSGAVFPLTVGASWSKTTNRTIDTSIGPPVTQTITYTGQVINEADLTLPAGTFRAAAIRSPSSGNPHTIAYYAESVGNVVRIESYDNDGALHSTQDLTAYKYQTAGLLLFLTVVGIVLGVGVLAALTLVLFRRRRAAMPPPPMPPAGPPPGA